MTCRYSIVIPTYNERENIIELLKRLKELLTGRDYEIIVVDDDSPDKTWQVVEEYAEDHPEVSCLRRTADRGLSPSIVSGFNRAHGDYLAIMDGDLQHDETCLPGILDAAENADLVLGTRYAEGGEIEGWPLMRKLGSRGATWLAKAFLGIRVSDPMSGFFVIRKSAYDRISSALNPQGFKILLELLYLLSMHFPEVKIAEYGIRFRLRVAGQSKMGLAVVLQYLNSLYKLSRLRKG